MLNCLGKVFENIILSRLSEFTKFKSILREEQFGLRKVFSTTHQIKRIVNIVKLNKVQALYFWISGSRKSFQYNMA